MLFFSPGTCNPSSGHGHSGAHAPTRKPPRNRLLTIASDDEGLARAIGQGDLDAIGRAYDAHAGVMYGVALRLSGNAPDAEDFVHDAFMRAMRSWKTFRGESTLRTWLVGIVVNRWRESRRHRSAMEIDISDAGEIVGVVTPDPSTRLDLEAAMARMPAGFREVVVLHDIEGFTHEEIARMLGIQSGTSKSQLARGRAWLRRALAHEDRHD